MAHLCQKYNTRMKLLHNYVNHWKKIPPHIRQMLTKGFVLLIVWKMLYTLWLAPTRLLDEPLTYLVADQTTWLMNAFTEGAPYSVGTSERLNKAETGLITQYGTILKDGKRMINIADPCNGLEFLLLYAWFILVMPGTTKRRITFLVGGLLLLHLSNLFRCWGLVVVHAQYPNIFDFAHHYLFKIIIYALSFGLWYWYLYPLKPEAEPDTPYAKKIQ